MSEQIKRWCDAITCHEDDLDFGSIKTLGMIKNESIRLSSENYTLRKAHESVSNDALNWKRECVKYYSALQKISDCDECDPEISISLLQLIAREAMECFKKMEELNES